jgi:hypothetical protein
MHGNSVLYVINNSETKYWLRVKLLITLTKGLEKEFEMKE